MFGGFNLLRSLPQQVRTLAIRLGTSRTSNHHRNSSNSSNSNNSNNNNNHSNNSNTNSSNSSNHSNYKKYHTSRILGMCAIATVAAAAAAVAVVNAAEADIDRVRPHKPKLVILGSGWGAVSLIKELRPGDYDVTIISPRNYFLFTPLLPSATTGTVESRSLVESIRKIAGRVNANYLEAKAVDVDVERKSIICKDDSGNVFEVPYDRMAIAVGARNNTFDTPGVTEHANFLKEINDARKIRSRIMKAFEMAALPSTPLEEKKRLLHFVVVGGGPTGVEFAGELHDFLNDDLVYLFPELCKEHVRVSLIQSGDHILNTFDESISVYTEKKFKSYDIDVITKARVLSLGPKSITYLDKDRDKQFELPYGVCVWSTGIKAVPFVERLSIKLNKSQSHTKALVTDSWLRVEGAGGDIFAFGDCATIAMPQLLKNVQETFAEADEDGDGHISYPEFKRMCDLAVERYPQMKIHIAQLDKLFKQYDINNDNGLDLNEFSQFLKAIDKNLKALPATAQVASQQGKYVAHQLNFLAIQEKREFQLEQKRVRDEKSKLLKKAKTSTGKSKSDRSSLQSLDSKKHEALENQAEKEHLVMLSQATTPEEERSLDHQAKVHIIYNKESSSPQKAPVLVPLSDSSQKKLAEKQMQKQGNSLQFEPFYYNHLGSFAYIGADSAAADFGEGITGKGWATFWLWRSIYLSKQVSLRTRFCIALDWVKATLFGRDLSQY